MPGSVSVPGIGPVKKPVLIAVGLGTAGVLAYAYIRRRRAAAADTTTTTDTTATDQTTADQYALAGAAAADSGYAVVPAGNVGTAAYSPYGYDVYGNPLPAPTQAGTAGGVYTTNADWDIAAINGLEATGTSEATGSLAISRVLGGLTVTSAQRDLFMEAVGLLGQPPQGYPQPIKLVDTPAQPAPTTTTAKPGKAGNVHATKVTRTEIALDWNAASHASGYHIDVNGRRVTSVQYSQYALQGLHPNSSYSITITPDNSAGTGPASTIHVRTHK
jgi:hypothetical protein